MRLLVNLRKARHPRALPRILFSMARLLILEVPMAPLILLILVGVVRIT